MAKKKKNLMDELLEEPILNKKAETAKKVSVVNTPKQRATSSFEEIAPIRKTENKLLSREEMLSPINMGKAKKNIQTAFDKPKPEDDSNLFATTANVLKTFGQGMMKAEEAMFIDTPSALISKAILGGSKVTSSIASIFDDELAGKILVKGTQASNKLNEIAKQDWTSNALEAYGWNKKLDNGKTVAEELESKSAITSNDLLGKAVEGLGGMAPTILLGGLLGGSTAGVQTAEELEKMKKLQQVVSYSSLGARSFGGAYEQALQSGATQDEAMAYGISSASVEIGTEWLSGGVPGVKGTVGGGLDEAFGKYVLKEGVEETSKSLSKAITKSLYKTSMEGVEEMISETLEPYIKQFTYEYDESKSLGENFNEASKKVSFQDIMEAGVVGSLTAVLLGDIDISDMKTGYQNTQAINNTIANEIQNQQNMLGRELTKEESNAIKTEIKDHANNVNQYGEEIANRIIDVKNNNTSTEGLDLEQSYKAYNGEKKYTKEITNIQKFMNNRNIDARFDATMFDNNEQNAIWTTQDGKDNVIFNPNASADQVIQNIATHEMTHDIINQKTEAGTSLFNEVLENIKTQKDYAKNRQEIEDLYAKYYDRNSEDFSAKVDEEMVANELGKNLGTQEYINRLVNEKPNLAKRIYNWVVDKLDNIGKSEEYKEQKAYWKSVADKFEKAYNEQKTATGEDKTAYSVNQQMSEKVNRAKNEIGTTTDLREAGYLTLDGEYLDFSGKKHGGQPGRRSMDHREIADIYTDEEYDNAEKKYSNLGTATAIMQDFIDEGNIRLMPEQGIDISVEPTETQYDKLNDYIDFVKDRNGEITIDIDKTGTGNYESNTYTKGTPTSKIINDIKEYFKTGTYPQQSRYADFRYSLTKDSEGRTLSEQQKEYFKDSKVVDDNGNLQVVYHGSPNEFTVFDKGRMKTGATLYASSGDGFYFTDSEARADKYSKDGYKYSTYLNITNPFVVENNLTPEANDVLTEFSEQVINNHPESTQRDFGAYELFDKNNIGQQSGTAILSGVVSEYGNEFTDFLKSKGYDGIKSSVTDYDNFGEKYNYVAFEPNQIKNIDNTAPTTNPDIRYSLSPTSIEDRINQSMTMNEAKKMIDIAFKENQINDWMDENEKYIDADDWLNKVGTDEVAMYIENGYSTIKNYLNPLYDRDNSFGDDYVLEEILEAYKNGTLTGGNKQQANRLDLTQAGSRTDTRFYSPQTIENAQEVYNKANERVTNSNRDEVYKARGQFVIMAHNQENIDNLGLDRQELNKKLKSWAVYSNKALELSNRLNKNVDRNNQWAGLENSSIINTASISNEELGSLVKNIDGDSSEWQRHYITSTMLALDTHIDYKDLSFQFDANQELKERNALGDYNKSTKTIRIGRGYQNTVSHEMGHYLDNKWAEDFGFLSTSNLTDKLNFESANVSDDVKQFAKNFNIFMDDLVKSATSESSSNVAYYQDRGEVFARFVGRFVEWTKNTASDGRFGYEDKYYKDNFTQSQYEEFVKLLQEKSMLDTTNQTYNKYSLNLDNDTAPTAPGTRTTYGELFDRTINENIAPIREDLSNITEQMNNLSNQIETLQNQLETTPQGYVETYNEQRNENIPTRNLTEEDANTLQDALMQDEGYLRSLDEQANQTTNNTKLVDKLTNEVNRRLDLDKDQRDTLRNIINESIEKGYSADELSYELYKKFSEVNYEMTNQEAIEAKRLLRDTPIKVADYIKRDIADYGGFKRRNFGKINFSNRGGAVDTVYMELSERMPYFFPEDIITPTDQLLKIAEVANMASKTTQTFDIDPDEFDNIADYITNTRLEDEYNAQMNSQYDLEKNIQFDMNEDIAPTTIRTQDSIADYIENRDIAPVKTDRTQQRQERTERRNNAWRSFREKITNRNAVIDDYAKATGNKQIKFTGDMLNSVSGEVQYNINNKQTDINGKTIGKGVSEIFEPSKKAGLYQVFNDYLFNKSNIERHRVGKGSQVPEAVSQQLVKQYEQQYPEVKEWAKDVYKYYDNVLQEQVNEGLITQEQYNNYRGEDGIYRSYTPFYTDNIDTRYFDNEGKIKPVSTLKRTKGNARDVSQLLSMEDAMAKQTYAYKRAIRQNELFKEIVSASEKYSDAMDMDVRDNPTNLNDSLYTTPEGDKVVTAYIDGEKVSAKITDELFNELSGENEARIKQFEEDFSMITNPLQRASSIRRNLLTTWNPTFLARNAIKDIQDAVINSKHTAGMLKNYIPGIKELSSAKTQTAQQFLALYGADNLYGDYSNISKGKKAINKFVRLNELIELAPRFAEFKASLQAGDSVQEAIYNAREVTTNFGRGGYITKALNRNGFTFLNANVQGLSKLVRNLSGENGVKGVTSVVVKGALFAVAPSIINHLLYGLDDDKDEEYEAIPDYIKDNYYLIKTEGNNFVRIPKGRINAVFGSLARRMIEAGEGEGFDFKEWGENAWNQIGVGDSSGIQTIFTPLRQAFGSKNGEAWYGGDIVPTRLQNKPAGEQTDAKIDAVSNFIGENLGISPYKINYVLDQYSGGIGDVLLPYITPETKNGAETFGEHLVAPIKDAFVVNSTDDNKYAGDFYDLKDKLEIQSNSEKATDDDKIKYKYMSEVSKKMGDLYKEKREVQADTTLGNKAKYKKVQKIQNEINSLAKEGLSTYQSANTTENYSEIGDTEYYKNAKNEWTKVNEDEQEFTAGLNTAEKDSYFKAKNKIYGITQKYSNKLKGLDKDDPSKSQIYADKKEEITKAIVNSGLDNYTKAMVYSKYYSNQDTMTNVVNAGYDVDTYITALNDIEQLRTKYSKNNGYTTEERKQKIIAYINSLNMEIPQKAMMIRNHMYKSYIYTSFRQYNNDIVKFVANLDLDYEDKKAILEGTGMTVNGNRVSWK